MTNAAAGSPTKGVSRSAEPLRVLDVSSWQRFEVRIGDYPTIVSSSVLRSAVGLAVVSVACGCARSDQGTPLTSPTNVSVAANAAWQDSGLRLSAGQSAQVRYLSGAMTDADTSIGDAAGSDYVCGGADCCEPLPTARRGSVIARLNDTIVAIGNQGRVTADADGRLAFRINDCDAGLFDNTGSLTLSVSPVRR